MRLAIALTLLATPTLADSFPFEGKWIQPGTKCGATYTEYSKTTVRHVFEKAAQTPTETCKINSVKGEYIVVMTCKDIAGDGPAFYKVTDKISLPEPGVMIVDKSTMQGNKINYTLCP